MPVPANFVTYNSDNTRLWEVEHPIVVQDITSTTAQLNVANAQRAPYQAALNTVDLEISSLSARIRSLEHDAITYPQAYYVQHAHRPSMYSMGVNIGLLKAQLDALYLLRTNRVGQLAPYNQACADLHGKLNGLVAKEAWLDKHIPASRSFLRTLNENPAGLEEALHQRTLAAFDEYEATHFQGLNPEVRIGLHAFRYGIQHLLGTPIVGVHNTAQMQYLKYCGFLWNMYSQVETKNRSPEFAKVLADLLESTHILAQGRLPDHMDNGYTAGSAFGLIQNANPAYLNLSEGGLERLEKDLLQSGLAPLFNSDRAKNSELQTHIAYAAYLIHQEYELKTSKKQPVDRYFYIQIMNSLTALYHNPADSKAVTRLGNLSNHVTGHSALAPKIIGSLCLVLGALLAAASIALIVVSFGSSSVFSAWGLTLGLSLLQTKIAAGIGLSVGAAIGIGMFAWGTNKLASGIQHGLSLKLAEIKDDAKEWTNQPPPPYVAPAQPNAAPPHLEYEPSAPAAEEVYGFAPR